MANTGTWPFKRLAVDHLILGGSRIWWRLDPEFNDPGPHTFQLQVGTTGLPTASDWRNVGEPIVDAFYADDDARRLYGQTLLTHYRVTLTTGAGTYVSEPTSVEGELSERDLTLAREIIRKERLRGAGLAWREGILLKRLRYGPKCTKCRDRLLDETTDSDCTECNGTGFQVGYHRPVPLCVEFLTQKINAETTDPSRGSINDVAVKIRCLGFPALNKEDVWVDGRSDERWTLSKVQHEAVMRGVPIVISADINMLPYTHPAYRVDVACGQEETLPGVGTGCIAVDHDYGGVDELQYASNGTPVADADVLVYRAADFTAPPTLPTVDKMVASTTTDADGRWVAAVHLDPGEYAVVFRKAGAFGPDVVNITVTAATASSSSSSGSSGSFWDV